MTLDMEENMELKGNYNRFIRYGLILIGLAGFIFAIGDALIPQEGDMFNAAGNPEGFAGLVTTDNYQFWALRGLIGVPLEVIGTIALLLGLAGTPKEKGAFWGMMLCVIGDLLGMSMFMIAYFIQILANVIWGSAYLWMASYSWKYFTQSS